MLEKTLESALDCKEIKQVNTKGNQPWISLEGLMLKMKLQYFGYLMQRADSLEKTLMWEKTEGQRIRGLRKRWLDGIIYSMDMSLSILWGMVKNREDRCAAVHGVAKCRTWLSDWTATKYMKYAHICLHVSCVYLLKCSGLT